MSSSVFCESFLFSEISLRHTYHCDSSQGVPVHYIRYMKSGTGKIISDRGRIDISPGDMFYIPKGLKYHSYWQGDDIVSFDSFGFEYFPSPVGVEFDLQKINYTNDAFEAYQSLTSDKTVSCRSVGLLYILMSKLMPMMTSAAIDSKSRTVEKIVRALGENPTFKTKKIAKMCGISESTLYTLIKQKLGKTPNEIRKTAQCEKAMELLRTTDMTIEEISCRMNFSSSSYFRKIFFSITGKTPREYRKENVI